MGLFDFAKKININDGVKRYKDTANSVLLDVRTVEEFKAGTIPSSVNLPLDSIANIASVVKTKDTPIFIFCRSGVRSKTACDYLKKNDYTNVHDIGGILDYEGTIEK